VYISRLVASDSMDSLAGNLKMGKVGRYQFKSGNRERGSSVVNRATRTASQRRSIEAPGGQLFVLDTSPQRYSSKPPQNRYDSFVEGKGCCANFCNAVYYILSLSTSHLFEEMLMAMFSVIDLTLDIWILILFAHDQAVSSASVIAVSLLLCVIYVIPSAMYSARNQLWIALSMLMGFGVFGLILYYHSKPDYSSKMEELPMKREILLEWETLLPQTRLRQGDFHKKCKELEGKIRSGKIRSRRSTYSNWTSNQDSWLKRVSKKILALHSEYWDEFYLYFPNVLPEDFSHCSDDLIEAIQSITYCENVDMWISAYEKSGKDTIVVVQFPKEAHWVDTLFEDSNFADDCITDIISGSDRISEILSDTQIKVRILPASVTSLATAPDDEIPQYGLGLQYQPMLSRNELFSPEVIDAHHLMSPDFGEEPNKLRELSEVREHIQLATEREYEATSNSSADRDLYNEMSPHDGTFFSGIDSLEDKFTAMLHEENSQVIKELLEYHAPKMIRLTESIFKTLPLFVWKAYIAFEYRKSMSGNIVLYLSILFAVISQSHAICLLFWPRNFIEYSSGFFFILSDTIVRCITFIHVAIALSDLQIWIIFSLYMTASLCFYFIMARVIMNDSNLKYPKYEITYFLCVALLTFSSTFSGGIQFVFATTGFHCKPDNRFFQIEIIFRWITCFIIGLFAFLLGDSHGDICFYILLVALAISSISWCSVSRFIGFQHLPRSRMFYDWVEAFSIQQFFQVWFNIFSILLALYMTVVVPAFAGILYFSDDIHDRNFLHFFAFAVTLESIFVMWNCCGCRKKPLDEYRLHHKEGSLIFGIVLILLVAMIITSIAMISGDTENMTVSVEIFLSMLKLWIGIVGFITVLASWGAIASWVDGSDIQ